MKITFAQISFLGDSSGEQVYDMTTDDLSKLPIITEEDHKRLLKAVHLAFVGFPDLSFIYVNEDLLKENLNSFVEGQIVLAIEHMGMTYVLSRSILQKLNEAGEVESVEGDSFLSFGDNTILEPTAITSKLLELSVEDTVFRSF